MTTFKLEIGTDGAAFHGEDNPCDMLDELARILRKAASTVESGEVGKGVLTDVNGNTVGRYELIEDDYCGRCDASIRTVIDDGEAYVVHEAGDTDACDDPQVAS
jgi:hypothetical protein